MPLLDHFHPPLSIDRPWEGFHSTWATAIAGELNDSLLPANFVAIPLVSRGAAVEIDVATLRERMPPVVEGKRETQQKWSPAEPVWTSTLDWSERDRFEIRVIEPGVGPRLVAAVELVSPANKDRPASRRAFAGKCAGYLRQGVALVVVDVVTDRQMGLHTELLELLELEGTKPFEAPLYAVAYRTVPRQDSARLEVWTESLSIGNPLPTLPLWLDTELAVPLDLGFSYAAACRLLRI